MTPISVLAFAALLILMPLFFGQLTVAALAKLHLTPEIAVVLTAGVIVGAGTFDGIVLASSPPILLRQAARYEEPP